MAKYIDADKIIEDLRESESKLRELYKGLKFDDERQICAGQITTFTECILRIKDAPEADVVEVVRCKNCRYFDKGFVNNNGFFVCSASGMEITDSDYCSYGERRKDDEVRE